MERAMPLAIDEVISDDLIEVVERNDEEGHYAIRLASFKTVIFIDLGRYRNSERTKYRVSHVIHTPMQLDGYRTSTPFADTWEDAFHKAIRGLTSFYQLAVARGHVPSEAWLETY
jgi:hypothetical protein